MSIRMKEWGMLGTPGAGVHLPIQGLMGWDTAAEKMGKGISALLLGSAELAQGQKRVEETGELAEFSNRLRAIGEETRSELAGSDVKDWDYAWRAASEPRLAEAVAELPPSARQAGMELARDYNNRAAVEAFRDRSVESLQKARGQWQSNLDRAVEQGDEPQALQWLQHGQGVFVPEGREDAMQQEVRSRACLSRWRNGLNQDVVGSLVQWENVAAEDLPVGEEEKKQLSEMMGRAKRSAQQTLAQHASQELQGGRDIPADMWEQAHNAGLISKEQLDRVSSPAVNSLAPADSCRWLRRIDEVEDDADSRLALRMEICTAQLPPDKRGDLLNRLDVGASVDREDRLTLSRHLWNLYNRGAFGCPGDAPACNRMADLQRHGLQLLADEGADAAARWVESRHRSDNRWICFSDSRTNA